MNAHDEAGQALIRLCELMSTLRGPNGCPWDKEQTYETLKPFLLEETYETLDAMGGDDPSAHCEELGDLLLQIVFQAQIAQEQGHFQMADVVNAIADKMHRRHPHVFGDQQAGSADEATESWHRAKAKERAPGASALDSIPRSLPSLLRARRVGEKAAALGFDWPSLDGVRAKCHEEWQELEEALNAGQDNANREHIREELGDLLLSLSSLARHLDIDPEQALRDGVDKFERRFRPLERKVAALDRNDESHLDRLDEMWEDAKSREGGKPVTS